ncbi:ATP phosphoribosyltransferase regulatory subunit [Hankyongella ginsenosidimutans]|uniref:Histidine--tRNA ligase n=1 Tax=Hankyongella ginsenosidimutans TaxID=1763828 RepID=A0A4D7C4A6_9SPHN|nr:ATP phosphoribosyltransferase regulatory subunit [Hankyongella ginsenosidimutans]
MADCASRRTAACASGESLVVLGRSPVTSRLAPGLLPEGLRDTLPPQAHGQMRLMRAILDVLSSHGYERVDPPLVEFAESLTSPIVSGARSDLFRFMDPKSQHMLAVRADITGQVARIASTRMAGQARPLRLAYMGPVLRLAGTALDADRQFLQVGGELIGNDGPAATAQTIAVAVEALRAAGLEQLSLDLVIPDLAPTLLRAHGVADAAPVLEALDAKDAGALAGHPLEALLVGLLDAAGPAAAGLARLRALDLPGAARALVDDAATTLDLLALADAAISLDPADRRGFAYQTRIGFSLFAPGVREAAVRGVPMSSARPPSRNRRLASRSISTVFWTRWLHRRRCRASICHGMPQPRPAPACAPRAG